MARETVSSSGARYYKCDLHMHTPVDANWRDPNTRINVETPDDRKDEIAREYLRCCHSVGLEVIGVTDHNFARKPEESFIERLRQVNRRVASEMGCAPLTILPGFEIEANVGTGCHVLCLFPEDTDLHVVESRLVNCGLGSDVRFSENGQPRPSAKNLVDILTAVQKCEQNAGLVIPAHPLAGKGLLSDENIEIWLQQEEFRNLDLLCIEIPRPYEELSTGLRKLIGGGAKCDPAWRRRAGGAERPIAYVQSSDAHRLTPSGVDNFNYIGYRYTWIKMSLPGIEALRQAFLDRDSRIRVTLGNPDSEYRHPRIVQVQVQGASFYRADPIGFSPNLNCVIGSRGSGKSTLVDYMRVALDRLREGEIPQRLYGDIADRVNRTLNDDSVVSVDFEMECIPYRVTYTHGDGGQRRITRLDTQESNPELDIRSLFPVKIISQREIDESVERDGSVFLTRLLDGFVADELEDLAQRETKLKAEIRSLDIEIQAKAQALQRRPALVTQQSRLQAQFERLDAMRAPLEHWTQVEDGDKYLKRLYSVCEYFIAASREQLEGLCHNLDEVLAYPPTGTGDRDRVGILICQAIEVTRQALAHYRAAVEGAISAFSQATMEDCGALSSTRAQWASVYSEEAVEYQQLNARLRETGDSPEEYLSVKEELDRTVAAIDQLSREQDELKALDARRAELLAGLRNVWREQTNARQRKAEEVMEGLRPSPGAASLVQIEVSHQGDKESVFRIWSTKLKDRRRLGEQDLRRAIDLADSLGDEAGSCVVERLGYLISASEMRPKMREVLGSRADVFVDTYDEVAVRQLQLERTADRVTYRVWRRDGSLAGPIERVSVGQRGLAFLHVLLASDNTPIIVDTPEEGLDNEGVYEELVPLFRTEKEKRQLIVATHNANLPVNADAEQIIALEAVGAIECDNPALISALEAVDVAVATEQQSRQHEADAEREELTSPVPGVLDLRKISTLVAGRDWHEAVKEFVEHKWPAPQAEGIIAAVREHRVVRGAIRSRLGDGGKREQAVGALDRTAVKLAVQDIMEGSEQAFRRRWEKYGF